MKRLFTLLAMTFPLVLLPAVLAAQQAKSLPGNQSQAVSSAQLDSLVALCETCHGPGGVSDRPDVPTLAGQNADQLFAEIERFYFYERRCPSVPMDDEDAARGHMSMCDVTSRINKQEAEALAAYFQAQPVAD